MKNKTVVLFIAIAAVFLLPACADMDRAKQAYKAGNYESARKNWEKLAEFGIPDAKVELALMYAKGNGVEKDGRKAVRLLQEAADAGNPRAMTELGRFYEEGEFIGKDRTKARDLYTLAARRGYGRADAQLGGMAEKDEKFTEAGRLYKNAFAKGYAKAAPKIAALYEKGRGYKADRIVALAWYYAAQNLGITDLGNSVSGLETSLDSVQSEQARKLSEGFIPK